MKNICQILLLPLLALVWNVALAVPTAYESVRESTVVLLEKLNEVQPLYEENPEAFFSAVQIALDPYIDFEGFSKRVMAKHYRKATPEQKSAFTVKFRDSLVRTYATALLEFDNQKVVVLDPQLPQKTPEKATIELEVYAQSGVIYPIRYQLGLEENSWLLQNVIINGINIGLQFRSQFNAYMQKYKGDIDSVIENWAVDVES